MISRAPRSFDLTSKPVGATPDVVGPNSYSVKRSVYSKDPAGVSSSYKAPFGSQTSRYENSLFQDRPASEWPTPEAAQYNIVDYDAPIIASGGSSIANRGRRFETPGKRAPDPGKYFKPQPFVKERSSAVRGQQNNTFARTKANNPAPIPARWETSGYKEDPTTGALIKASSKPTTGKELAPNSYSIEKQFTTGPSAYKGCGFSKRTGARVLETAKTRDGPAPGAYNIPPAAIKTATAASHRRDHGTTPSQNVDRAVADKRSLVRGEAPRLGPAPNAYSLPPTFTAPQVPRHLQFFGTTAARQGIMQAARKDVTPAPGTYYASSGASTLVSHATWQQDRRPFNQSSARFAQNTRQQSDPGPAGYNVESWSAGSAGMAASSYAVAMGTSPAPFGTTSTRKPPFDPSAKAHVPPPGTYGNGASSHGTTRPPSSKKNASAAFKSTVPSRPPVRKDGPGPASYTIGPATDAIKHVSPPRNQRAVYVGTAKRFGVHGTSQVGKYADPSNPPPNSYNAQMSSKAVGGRILDHQKARFGVDKHDGPAPNRYTLQGQHADTLLKPSFNVGWDT
eukprot:m.218409 g.218409  ORF g.218409 m.218409 type:complete len:565 (+) comp19153_c0_seq1:130-1824(+)